MIARVKLIDLLPAVAVVLALWAQSPLLGVGIIVITMPLSGAAVATPGTRSVHTSDPSEATS